MERKLGREDTPLSSSRADHSICMFHSPGQINVIIKPVEEAAGGKHWLVTQTTVGDSA